MRLDPRHLKKDLKILVDDRNRREKLMMLLRNSKEYERSFIRYTKKLDKELPVDSLTPSSKNYDPQALAKMYLKGMYDKCKPFVKGFLVHFSRENLLQLATRYLSKFLDLIMYYFHQDLSPLVSGTNIDKVLGLLSLIDEEMDSMVQDYLGERDLWER